MTDLDRLFGAQQRNMRATMEQASRERSAQKDAERNTAKAARVVKRRSRRKAKPEPERAGQGTEQQAEASRQS
jgi:hypothetical protein